MVQKKRPHVAFLEVPSDRCVDLGYDHAAAPQGSRQAAAIGFSVQVDVDAGPQRQRGGVGDVFGDAVGHKLGDGGVVADDDAREAPPVAHQMPQDRRVGAHGYAREIDKGGHDRCGTGRCGRLKRRQIDLVQGQLRHVDRCIFPSGCHRSIACQMLCRCGETVRGREIAALESPHLCLGKSRGQVRVLAGALGDPAPAGIPRHVEHRREGEDQPIGGGLVCGGARRALPQVRVEGGSLAQRDGEDRSMAVDHIRGKQQRDSQACLLDRNALHLVRPRSDAWTPTVITCSALEQRGIDDVWTAVEDFARATAGAEQETRRREQARAWMRDELADSLLERLHADGATAAATDDLEADVAAGRLAPTTAARWLLDVFFKKG